MHEEPTTPGFATAGQHVNALPVVAPAWYPVWCPVASMRAEHPYGPGGLELRNQHSYESL